MALTQVRLSDYRHLVLSSLLSSLPTEVIDHHVHLGLIDAAALACTGVTRVVDLGWTPGPLPTVPGVAVDRAGQFLAAPQGYPSDRSWAPAGSVRAISDIDDAAAAVAEQRALAAAVIKVTLHASAGPVPTLAILRALVAAADPLTVVAHAEGPGMVELALAGGAQALAHTPWTERLDDELVSRCAAAQAWISTLDIHGYGRRTPELETALDNLSRFAAAGGRVLYGTDLGNGPLPVGVNHRELELLAEAGLDEAAIAVSLSDPWPRP